jgi:hypothetical protein
MLDDQRVLGIAWDQGALRRGKTGRVKDPVANVGDLAFAPVIAPVLCREDDTIQHRAPLRSRHPAQDLRPGHPRFHIEMVAMQGRTAVLIGGTSQQGGRKLPPKLFGTRGPPCGVAHYHQRNRRVTVVVEQPLMGRGVIEGHKRLVGLLARRRGGGQRER